ncbi:hypothetical protein DFJ74DRAFT_747300 [Hyaloraphidium curvatum]|nr:hypothetical protein DFJ74DRAFT_747300 [Hyaloraphidium curvatum]
MEDEVKLDVEPRPFSLGGAEWLAVLPAAPDWSPDLPAAAPTDPAAEARKEAPLDFDAFVGALEPKAGAMAASVRLQVHLDPWGRRALLRSVAVYLGIVGITVVFCVFGAGYYGAAQLAAGAVSNLGQVFAGSLGVALFAAYRSSLQAVGDRGRGKQLKAIVDFSHHGAAGLARWLQVASAPAGSLLEHEPNDSLCPCSAPSCAGNLPGLAGVARFAESFFKFTIFLLYTALAVAAVAIFPPFSSRIWATVWAATILALFCTAAFAFGVPVSFVRFSTNLPLLQLSRRRYRDAVDSGKWSGAEKPERASYMLLHRLLSCSWRNSIRTFSTSSPMLLPVSTAIACGLVNMAAGSCLPALYPAYLAYIFVATLIFDLIHVAASNAQITGIRSLYLDAAQELAALRRELTSCASSPPDSALLAAIEADSAVLAGYIDTDRYRARFLGFVVTFGTVRTLIVTALTLVLGLWSVFRNLGIVLTGELACPPRA